MQQRELLIKEIIKMLPVYPLYQIDAIADFIINDRKRYIEGLRAAERIFEHMEYSPCCKAEGLNDYEKFKKSLTYSY